MFNNLISTIKSMFSIIGKEIVSLKKECHYQLTHEEGRRGYYFKTVYDPIPQTGELGTVYFDNKSDGLKVCDGEKYLPVANGGTGATTAKEVIVTELPLIGDPYTVYVIAGDGYRETYTWSSLSSCFILTEDRSNEIQESVYS